METLTLRPTPRQLGALILLVAALAAGAAFLLRNHLAGGDPSGRILGFGIGCGTTSLLAGIMAVLYSRAYTECTPFGIRCRGLGGPAWSCDWNQVSEIAIRRGLRNAGYTVMLTTTTGARHFLGAPVTGGFMPDPRFSEKVDEIRTCWRMAVGDHDVSAVAPVVSGAAYPATKLRPGPFVRTLVTLVVLAAVAAFPVAFWDGGTALRVGSAVIAGGTTVEILWIAWLQWQGRSRRARDQMTSAGLPSDRMDGAVRQKPDSAGGWFVLTLALVVAFIGVAGYAVTLQPARSSSPTTLACNDYDRWLQAQSISGPPNKDPAALSEAQQVAPNGALGADLDTLASDVDTAVAQGESDQGLVAQLNVINDENAMSKDCG